MSKMRIAFIGAGNMASSLIGGLLAKGLEAAQIRASDPGAETRAKVAAEHGIELFADNAQAIQDADVIVIAVKPQAMKAVCQDLRAHLQPHQLLVSIAAGITCASLLSVTAQAATLTRDNGAAVGDNQNSQTAGANGPVLLQDVQLLQKLQRFDRERIPERVVHARGTGAHGTFTVTNDLSDLTKAKVFAKGETTPVFVRFSAVVHSAHSPETLRDPRGFATKFYTADGNWDLVGNNFPTFFIRDAIKFPDMVHAFKPDPRTNLDDDSRRFDFFSHVPEATRTLTELYSDSGTPASYREMDGNGVHAYKLVNAKSFDGHGNYSMGVKEQIIFPEIDYDKIDALRGLDITLTTTAKNDDEGRALLRAFKFPFRN